MQQSPCYGQSHDGTWTPSYVENVSQSDLLKMLRAFLNDFLSALKYKHSNKYLLQWLSGNT